MRIKSSIGSFQLCFGPGGAYVDNTGTEAVDKPDPSWDSQMKFNTIIKVRTF